MNDTMQPAMPGTADAERFALSLKPDHDTGEWQWCLASESRLRRGRVAARDREDAALCAIGAAHVDVVTSHPVQVVVTLAANARLWSVTEDVAAAWPGVTLTPHAETDAPLRTAAMRGLEPSPSADSPVPPPPLAPLTIATDGSAHRGRIAWGWLAENGNHGCATATPPREQCTRKGHIVLAELQAISEAIRRNPSRPLVIRSDSRHAITLVHEWMAGGDRLPRGYGGTHHTATQRGGLRWMQEQVRREAGRIDLGWVAGHTGDPLNEGADSLAKIARRAAEGGWGYGPEDVVQRASEIAATFTDPTRFALAV